MRFLVLKTFLFCLLHFITIISYTQEQFVAEKLTIDIGSLVNPQNNEDWNRPGVYEIVGNLSRSRISRGDSTFLSVFITGYGLSGKCKIFILPSEPIFSEESKLSTSLTQKYIDTFRSEISFGGQVFPMPQSNTLTISLQGIKKPTWKYSTLFIDEYRDKQSLAILTEDILEKPPIKFTLISKNDIEPGDYNINLYMTYFNGVEWKSSKLILPIHINNLFEEWPWIAYILSALGVGIALTAFVYQIKSFYRDGRKKDKSPKQAETQEPQQSRSDPKPEKQKKTPEQKEKAKAQHREFVSKWKWKIKSIFLFSSA